jgi:hypothetical protein
MPPSRYAGSVSRSGSHGNGLHLAWEPTACDLFCSAGGRFWPVREQSYRLSAGSACRGTPGVHQRRRRLPGTPASDPGCVKTVRGITAPGILRLVVTLRAKKRKNSSSAWHYDQIRFRFRTAWPEAAVEGTNFLRCEMPLLDHLVGSGQQRFRDGEAKGFGGL